MTNTFDNDSGKFAVLVNGESQHSLAPASASVPGGWGAVTGSSARQDCLDYVRNAVAGERPRDAAA